MQNIPVQERFSVPTTQVYSRHDWQRGYESQRREEAYWIDEVEGEIPPELSGTLFRNGPGLLDVGGTPIHHPFDGDGMICAIAFDKGRAYFQNRFVRTEGFVKEREVGDICYRGVFGTQKAGGWLSNAFDFNLKNIANTNIIYWGGKLLALWEADLPHRLDPYTLKTIGVDNLDGLLEESGAFAAHPWVDPSAKSNDGKPCLVNFCLKPGLSTTVFIYELDLEGKLLRKHAHSLPGFAFIHDFAITPNYCILFQNPVKFNPLPFVFGVRGAGECVKFQPDEKTRIALIPRHGGEVQFLETKAGFVFHHANAFELSEDKLCIDSICYEYFPEVEPGSDFREVDFDALAPGQLWRFTLDLAHQKVSRELAESRCCEFPFAHPDKAGRPYRYLFLGAAHQESGNAPLQAIEKFDWETRSSKIWSVAPRGYIGEPVLISKPGATKEDGVWVMTLIYDASEHRSQLVILDGEDLNPIARLHLKYHIPYGLHGSWSDYCFLPEKAR